MDIKLEVRNEEQVGRFVRYLVRDQLPFVTSLAINRTAERFQERQRRHMRREFEIRNEAFLRFATKRTHKAKKRDGIDRMGARVAVTSPPGRDAADIIGKFEEGEDKVARPGGRLAVPSNRIRRTMSGRIRKPDLPVELMRRYKMRQPGRRRVFRGKGIDRAASGVWFGTRGVYMVKTPQGTGGIYQRPRGGGQGPSKLLYAFTPRAEIDARLDFIRNARKTVNDDFAQEFHRAFMYAMRTAR